MVLDNLFDFIAISESCASLSDAMGRGVYNALKMFPLFILDAFLDWQKEKKSGRKFL